MLGRRCFKGNKQHSFYLKKYGTYVDNPRKQLCMGMTVQNRYTE